MDKSVILKVTSVSQVVNTMVIHTINIIMNVKSILIIIKVKVLVVHQSVIVTVQTQPLNLVILTESVDWIKTSETTNVQVLVDQLHQVQPVLTDSMIDQV